MTPAIFEWKNQTDFDDLKVLGICSDVDINEKTQMKSNIIKFMMIIYFKRQFL
ncbi:hypothetical protein MCAV_06840 [[Mycoplasma] cavipharyngis]